VASIEAAWKLQKQVIVKMSNAVIQLSVHLTNGETVFFEPGQEDQAISNLQRSHLLVSFVLNIINDSARTLLYTDIP
jgi:hypothetical protein